MPPPAWSSKIGAQRPVKVPFLNCSNRFFMEHIVTVLVSCGAVTKNFFLGGGGGGEKLGEKLPPPPPPPPPPRFPHWIEPIDVQIDIRRVLSLQL